MNEKKFCNVWYTVCVCIFLLRLRKIRFVLCLYFSESFLRISNEERKQKLKVFVESKANELCVSRQQSTEYSTEIMKSRLKLKECREEILQLKETIDQERYVKKGDTLSQELEHSQQETEKQHTKHNLAKNEFISVFKKLEVEQSIFGKLRDALKFTLTPKASSKQQLLHEGIEPFDSEIAALAKKTGKELSEVTADVLEYVQPSSSTHSNSNVVGTRKIS